jgi:hypothetical protein
VRITHGYSDSRMPEQLLNSHCIRALVHKSGSKRVTLHQQLRFKTEALDQAARREVRRPPDRDFPVRRREFA